MSAFERFLQRTGRHVCGGILACSAIAVSAAADTAILIGVNMNRSREDADLRFAVADAELMETTLLGGGFPEKGILRITDSPKDGAHFPLLENIRQTLRERLPVMQSEDRLILYFSGHATVVDGQWLLVPYDFDRRRPLETGLPFTELQDSLARCPARHKLLLLDCCRSALVTAKGADQEVQKEEEQLPLANMLQSTGTVVIAGCRPGRKSYEHSDRGHGYFTLGVAEALAGQADQPTGQQSSDGWVDTLELGSYVPRRVRELAAADNLVQEPVTVDFDAPDVFRVTKTGAGGLRAMASNAITPASVSATTMDQSKSGDQSGSYFLTKSLFFAAAVLGVVWFFRGLARRPRTVRNVGRERQVID